MFRSISTTHLNMRMRGLCLSLVFVILAICLKSTFCDSKPSILVRRFVHGCPFMFPCPPPPCENAVFGPGNCCGSCPEETKTTTTATAMMSSGDAPNRLRLKKSKLQNIRRRQFQAPWTTTTYPTTSECPYPCTHHGYQYCHPLPCYINCVDAVKQPGGCCYECLNGPNCAHGDVIIPEGTNVTLASGEVAYCSNGGLHGGNVQIYNVLGR